MCNTMCTKCVHDAEVLRQLKSETRTQLLMAPRRYPTWASGGAMGVYSWPVPVVIAVGLLIALGIMMIDP